jgi:hypothetical protein
VQSGESRLFLIEVDFMEGAERLIASRIAALHEICYRCPQNWCGP